MATIGRASAIADFGWLRLRGLIAWLAWLFVHIMNLIGFRNRIVVLVQWAWAYFSYQRAIRLITGPWSEPGGIAEQGRQARETTRRARFCSSRRRPSAQSSPVPPQLHRARLLARIYPSIQQVLTLASNMSPIAVLDIVIGGCCRSRWV